MANIQAGVKRAGFSDERFEPFLRDADTGAIRTFSRLDCSPVQFDNELDCINYLELQFPRQFPEWEKLGLVEFTPKRNTSPRVRMPIL